MLVLYVVHDECLLLSLVKYNSNCCQIAARQPGQFGGLGRKAGDPVPVMWGYKERDEIGPQRSVLAQEAEGMICRDMGQLLVCQCYLTQIV